MRYGCGFFPWPRPVTVEAGDTAAISLEASLVGDDSTGTWRTRLGDTRFTQSTFFGQSLSAETLRKRAADHLPELNEEGRVALRVFEAMARQQPLAQLAEALLAEFPGRFRSAAKALGFVGNLSGKYSD